MKEATIPTVPKGSVALLAGGSVLLTCGALLLIYAWAVRFQVVRFLDHGIEAQATILSIGHRGGRYGGRRIKVSFRDTGKDSILGDVKFAEITDLVPMRHGGEKEGDVIAIRWFEEDDRLRLAPERSLHAETRPLEMQYLFGMTISATGGVLLGLSAMREARRRERSGGIR